MLGWFKIWFRTGLIGILCVALAAGACAPESGTDSSSDSTSSNVTGAAKSDSHNDQADPNNPDGLQIHPDDPDGSTTPGQTNNTSAEPTSPGIDEPTPPDASDKLFNDMDSEEIDQACVTIYDAFWSFVREPFLGENIQTHCRIESAIDAVAVTADYEEAVQLCEYEFDFCVEYREEESIAYEESIYSDYNECIDKEYAAHCDVTMAEVLSCLNDKKATKAAYFASYQGKTCSELATIDMVEAMQEDYYSTYSLDSLDSCEHVQEKCPDMYVAW